VPPPRVQRTRARARSLGNAAVVPVGEQRLRSVGPHRLDLGAATAAPRSRAIRMTFTQGNNVISAVSGTRYRRGRATTTYAATRPDTPQPRQHPGDREPAQAGLSPPGPHRNDALTAEASAPSRSVERRTSPTPPRRWRPCGRSAPRLAEGPSGHDELQAGGHQNPADPANNAARPYLRRVGRSRWTPSITRESAATRWRHRYSRGGVPVIVGHRLPAARQRGLRNHAYRVHAITLFGDAEVAGTPSGAWTRRVAGRAERRLAAWPPRPVHLVATSSPALII
jgi:hypothetical protein